MRSGRGRLLVIVAVLLVVLVALSLTLAAMVAPVFLVLELAIIALVAGLASRLRRPARRSPAAGSFPQGGSPDPERETETGSLEPPWVMQWQSGPPVSAVPFVREQLTRVLADWGLAAEASEPTLLVATELLTNAVEHARAPIQLTVRLPGDYVRVEVHDAATDPPRRRPRDDREVRGRGLQLVEGLSAGWGWTPDAAGKTVWADVRIGWPT